MIITLSNRRAKSFNHRHLNIFTFLLKYVAKLDDSYTRNALLGGAADA